MIETTGQHLGFALGESRHESVELKLYWAQKVLTATSQMYEALTGTLIVD